MQFRFCRRPPGLCRVMGGEDRIEHPASSADDLQPGNRSPHRRPIFPAQRGLHEKYFSGAHLPRYSIDTGTTRPPSPPPARFNGASDETHDRIDDAIARPHAGNSGTEHRQTRSGSRSARIMLRCECTRRTPYRARRRMRPRRMSSARPTVSPHRTTDLVVRELRPFSARSKKIR